MCSQEHNPAKITDCQLVRDLILAGVDINCVDKRSRNALQILLSFCKSIGLVQLMLSAGANIHNIDEEGEWPIVTAINSSQSIEMLKLLIQAGSKMAIKTCSLIVCTVRHQDPTEVIRLFVN